MSCIVGLIDDEGTVWMGADSLVTDLSQDWCIAGQGSKIVRRHNCLIGCVGQPRIAQVLEYSLDMPDPSMGPPLTSLKSFDEAFELTEAIRKCLRDSACSEVVNNTESFAGTLLVGYYGRLFIIDHSYTMTEPKDRYVAIGSGSPAALGALYATQGQTPEHRIRIVLEAAAATNPYVREPFHIQHI